MGLFDRTLGSLLSGKAQNVAMATIGPTGIAAFPNLRYETFVREGYMKNPIVFACVDEWVTDISEPEMKVWKNGKDGPEEVENHEATELANHPNPFMSGDAFYGGIELHKRLAGNAYEYKVRSGSTKVVEKWLLRPDRMTIIPSRTTYIDRYEYRVGAEKYDLDPKDVIHHKTQHPYDDYYGMPPLMPASGSTDIFNFMQDMIKGFLNSTGMPAGILQVEGKINDAEKALIRSKFRTDFGGMNSGNIMISDGGSEAPKFTPLSMPLGARGLVVPELDEMEEARICMVFRVPLSLVGARLAQIHSTLGQGGREADRSYFTEQQLVPEWKLIAAVETAGMRGDALGDDEYYDFDLSNVRSLGENEDVRSARILQQQKELARSIQETRAELNLPPDPKPDDLFAVPINVVLTRWADIIAPPEPVAPVIVQPGQLPGTNGQQPQQDNLPAPPPQKRLPSPVVVNLINPKPGVVKKVFEYDDEQNILSITESEEDA